MGDTYSRFEQAKKMFLGKKVRITGGPCPDAIGVCVDIKQTPKDPTRVTFFLDNGGGWGLSLDKLNAYDRIVSGDGSGFVRTVRLELKREVKLTYFKFTGKYYSEGSFETETEYDWDIYRQVREMLEQKKLPGLIEGVNDHFVLVEIENGVPALVHLLHSDLVDSLWDDKNYKRQKEEWEENTRKLMR